MEPTSPAGKGCHSSGRFKDGAITGQTTARKPDQGQHFPGLERRRRAGLRTAALLQNRGQQRQRLRLTPAFGTAARSLTRPTSSWAATRATLKPARPTPGILYEERGRGILAERGQRVVVKPDPANPDKTKIEVLGTLGSSDAIQGKIKANDWNEYVIIARGNHLQHFINGQQTIDVTDEQPAKAAKSGILALQLHAGEPMTVQFKNIRLKTLSGVASARTDGEQLQGQWQPAEIIDKGEKRSADTLAEIQLKIKGSAFTLRAQRR